MTACPNCGEENPERFRLCGFCGTPLVAPLPPQEERRVVTVLFSDLKGSTSIGEALDPESLREVMSRYFGAMTEVIERHGGTIEKFIGDAIMAVFGLPRLHEDDALRAVRAAAGMQLALERLNRDLERSYGVRLANRTGVNTGEVVTGDSTAGQRLVTGDTVNVAARLEQAAPADGILLGELTHHLISRDIEAEPVEPLELKGKSARVQAFRFVRLAAQSTSPHALSPLLGRAAEQELLRTALATVVERREPRVVAFVGDAGVGKSRLVHDFVAEIEATVRTLHGRCLPYGEGITFWPLVEVLRRAAGYGDDETREVALDRLTAVVGDDELTDRLASAVGLTQTRYPLPEIFDAAKRFLERLAADGPIVLVVDDVHWAEPTFLELLDHITRTSAAPLLILCTARPELEEQLADWPSGQRAQRVFLAPLDDRNTHELVERLLGGSGIPQRVRRRIVEAAAGNPFFVEQLIPMLIETGSLRRKGDRWFATRDVADIGIPPSVQAVLAARLDNLAVEDRRILEPAAVIGLEFPTRGVEALAPEPLKPQVPARLQAACRSRLIESSPARIVGLDGYRFQHLLIRDAAYQRLLKRARATLHEAFVSWVQQLNEERGRQAEYDEINGYHLERAYRYLVELGPLDEHATSLGRRAATHLSAAGRRAFQRGDMPAATNLLGRATAVLADEDPDRVILLVALGEALMETGAFDEAHRVLNEAAERADVLVMSAIAIDARLTRLIVERYAGAPGWGPQALEETGKALPALESAAHHPGLVKAWRLQGYLHMTAGRNPEAARAAERMIEHARAAADERQEALGSVLYAMAVVHGPTPVPDAIERCREILERAAGDRRTQSLVLCCLAELEAMEGHFERARDDYRTARRQFEELGLELLAASVSLNSWRVEMLAGDRHLAEVELRRDVEALERIGERYLLSTAKAALAQVVFLSGELDESESLAEAAIAAADDDDVATQSLARSVLGKVRAARGLHDEAIIAAREALQLARSADAPVFQIDALIDLADTLVVVGTIESATSALIEARTLVRAKGDRITERRIEERLAFLAPAVALQAEPAPA